MAGMEERVAEGDGGEGEGEREEKLERISTC